MINISQPDITDNEIQSVIAVLKSGHLSQGRLTEQFERAFANYCKAPYAVAVSSGTAALHCALHALGIKEGDEVITSPFTFVATANAILMAGAKPVFSDITYDTFAINPSDIERKVNKKTKAIIPVNLYGHIYDVKTIHKIAQKNNLKIIEDACQAHGAQYKNRRAGTLGKIGCFSFYATKNITTGEGGMLVTRNKKYAQIARKFRQHGRSENNTYDYDDLGFNYRMTDIAAAIGMEQLRKINQYNDLRIEHAHMLNEGLTNLRGIQVPVEKGGYKHVFHQYTIRVTRDFPLKRDSLAQYLRARGIASAVFYPKPLHLQKHFMKFGYKKGDFPVAEQSSKEVLSLPIHPLVSRQDIKYIIKIMKEI